MPRHAAQRVPLPPTQAGGEKARLLIVQHDQEHVDERADQHRSPEDDPKRLHLMLDPARQNMGSTGEAGVPRASIALPASKHKSSRKWPARICTPTGTEPIRFVVTARPGSPKAGGARNGSCAFHTRWKPASPCRSSPSGNGNSPETGSNNT